MNTKQLLNICNAFNLGAPRGDATPISGGLIHRMWKLDTNHGSFAIKELDATIMTRPGIHKSFIQSEIIATALKNEKIPIATALIAHATPLYETGGSTVMVFPWIKGSTWRVEQVTSQQAVKIGTILADIHTAKINMMDTLPIPETHKIISEHWQSLINEALVNKLPWATEADQHLMNLISWSKNWHKAKQRMNSHLIIGHKDMDPKNVLWCDDGSPVIIDWESAGLINPTEELIAVAIEWAGMTESLFRSNIFSAVINGYCNGGGHVNKREIPDAVYGLIGGCLGWLEFNMYRSLSSSMYDINIQKLGYQEVVLTLKKLNFLAQNMALLISLVT